MTSARRVPGSGSRRRAIPVALLTLVALTACSGDDGKDGKDGKNGTGGGPPPVIGTGDALPGFHVSILGIEGGTGPAGNFVVGDVIRLKFTVEDADGNAIPPATWDRGRVYVSGPTFNYQRVIDVLDDVAANAVADDDGVLTYTFSQPIPATYLAPLHASENPPQGTGPVWTGQPLLAGTYTVAFEGRMVYETDVGGTIRDQGNVTADFRFGDAAAVTPRAVVGAANCATCHGEFRAHGGNRRDVNGCLLCHTSGAFDADGSDVSIDFKVMIHKIHTAAHLPSVLGMSTDVDGNRVYDVTPQPYVVGDTNYSKVTLPYWPNAAQPMPRDVGWNGLSDAEKQMEDAQRSASTNCALCHGDPDGTGPLEAPAGGDVIFAQPSRGACGSCHDDWVFDRKYVANDFLMPPQLDEARCPQCHKPSGDALSVRDAHRHPLLNPDFALGCNVTITAVEDVGALADGDGRLETGERLRLTMTVTDDRGTALDAATAITRRELTISGPTTNPNLLQFVALPAGLFTGPQPYVIDVPEQIWVEWVGTSNGSGNQLFGTARAPHLDMTDAETVVRVRTATGASLGLVEAAPARQNFVDVPLPSTDGGPDFVAGTYLVIADGVLNEQEYQRIRFVDTLADRRRLWFSSRYANDYPVSLRHDHALGTSVRPVTLTTMQRGTDYTYEPADGTIRESSGAFGTGRDVVVDYVAPFELPSTHPGTLNDSPDVGSDHGDWAGLPIAAGTYQVNVSMETTRPFNAFGQTTDYIDGSRPTLDPDTGALVSFLVGDAADLEFPQRIADAAACAQCHGELQFHGNHRRGYETCIQCHGAAAAEDRPRYVASGAPATTGVVVEFRNMLHKIHHGRDLSAGADYQVVGYGRPPAGFTVHSYENVGYPRFAGGTGDCASCHGEVDAWKSPAPRRHPTATGAVPTRSWFVACISCHDEDSDRAHADVNTSRTGDESCATCHGAGKDLSVERVHLVR